MVYRMHRKNCNGFDWPHDSEFSLLVVRINIVGARAHGHGLQLPDRYLWAHNAAQRKKSIWLRWKNDLGEHMDVIDTRSDFVRHSLLGEFQCASDAHTLHKWKLMRYIKLISVQFLWSECMADRSEFSCGIWNNEASSGGGTEYLWAVVVIVQWKMVPQ